MSRIYKILLIVTAIVALAVLGVLLWRVLQPRPPAEIPGELPSAPDEGEEPTGPEEPPFTLQKLSDDGVAVFDSFTDPDGNPLYLETSGVVREAKVGPDPEVSTETFNALNFVKPSPDRRHALLAYGDPKNPDWILFDTKDLVWRPFNVPMIAATWKDADILIAVLPETGGGRVLAEVPVRDNFTNPATAGPHYTLILRDFPLLDVTLSWSDALDVLIIQEKTALFYEPRTWQFNLTTRTLQLLAEGEKGEVSRWLTQGYILRYEPPREFQVLDHALRSLVFTSAPTIPEKCGAAEVRIFCFTPVVFPPFSFTETFAEDYAKGGVYTVDSFRVIDAGVDETTQLFTSGTGDIPQIDARSVRTTGDTVYFVNRYDNGLYELKLNQYTTSI